MTRKLAPCRCCRGPLEPAQQLRFLVETDTLGEPEHLARIRRLPSVDGRPVPVCAACQAKVEADPRLLARPRLPAVLGALGALSAGLLLVRLLAPRG